MPSANVDAVRCVIGLYGRLNPDPSKRRGSPELEELLRFFGDDVEFVQAESLPGAQAFHGRRRMERSWADWLGSWAGFRTEIEEIHERGDQVLVLSRDHFLGRDGVEIENRGGSVFTFRDGLIVRFEAFADQDSARQTFGAG